MNLIKLKFSQILLVIVLYFGGLCFLGMDIVYAHANDLYINKYLVDRGFVIDDWGFLIRISNLWVGVGKRYDGVIDFPVANLLWIVVFVTSLWRLVFNWWDDSL